MATTVEFYGDIDMLLRSSGIRPVDFGLTTEVELRALLRQWFIEARGIIDSHRRRDFLLEATSLPDRIPPLVHHCADRLVANMVALAQARRGTPVIRVGDYEIRMVDDKILSPDIESLLSLVPAGRDPRWRGPSSLRALAIRGRVHDVRV